MRGRTRGHGRGRRDEAVRRSLPTLCGQLYGDGGHVTPAPVVAGREPDAENVVLLDDAQSRHHGEARPSSRRGSGFAAGPWPLQRPDDDHKDLTLDLTPGCRLSASRVPEARNEDW